MKGRRFLHGELLDRRDDQLAVAPAAGVRLGDDQFQVEIFIQFFEDGQADGRGSEKNHLTIGHFFSFG